jgi:NADP-dependent 3-hydroxy acid dehydrogenase YdfG
MKHFDGKVAAITGAGSGIGRALAQALAARGCHLALADLDATGLAQTAQLVAAGGVRITTQVLDVAQRDAVYDWAARYQQAHGSVNLIVNNAGVALSAAIDGMAQTDLEWLMGVNFWGVVHGTQAFLPLLKASGDGHVVNLSSVFGIVAMPTQGAYNAAKFAVRGFTEALRIELELEGAPVSATCVHPGGVKTRIADAGRVDAATVRTLLGQPSIERHRARSNQLISRTTPEAAARQILDGVQRNARRVLVGPDAKALDLMARLLGAGYQALIVRRARRERAKELAA